MPPRAKSQAQKQHERNNRQAAANPQVPEDFLPTADPVPLMDIPRAQLSGMIKLIRGVFGEGVHLHLRPLGPDGPIVSARLEMGRRFLDSSPEVLVSRYGLTRQDWTVVGMVGQLGRRSGITSVEDVTNGDKTVNRAKLVDLVASFLGETAGLVDLPQAPGFSIIPLALYRSIGAPLSPKE